MISVGAFYDCFWVDKNKKQIETITTITVINADNNTYNNHMYIYV